MRSSAITALALALSASAAPSLVRRAPTQQQIDNANAAKALNTQFATTKAGDACTVDGCIGSAFAKCNFGKLVNLGCAPGTQCAAMPNTESAGTTPQCTTQANIDATFGSILGAGGAAAPPPPPTANTTNNAAGGNDPQTSLTLDPSVIAKGFANDGQDQPEAGQVPSLTSTNNFINFCVGQTITNGQQITTGSCNPAPLGQIPSTTNIPSSKFVFPKNFDTSLKANTPFTVQMAIKNLDAGNFVNAQQNYYSAPQQVNKQGQIIGHTHFTIEALTALDQTTPNDPSKFAFFKGVNTPPNAQGIVTADVTAGLPAGVYRLASINAAANHQPVLAPVAQHASLDDFVYFTVA